MSFCMSCGAEKGDGRFCPKCGTMEANTSYSESPSSMQAPAPTQPSTQQAWGSGASVSAPTGFNATGVSGATKPTGGVITLTVFAALACISPWLAYLSADGDSGNGWDVQDGLKDFDKFSSGAILILISGLVALGVATGLIMRLKQGQPISAGNRKGLGITTLVAGIVMLLSGGATYNALDEVLQEAGEYADQGIGLWLGCVMGLAITIMGIVILSKPSVTAGRK